MTDDDRDIEEMTPGDWREGGRWDAAHVADPDMLLPYAPLDLAVWATFHHLPVERLVDHLIGLWPHGDVEGWCADNEATPSDFEEWRRGFDAHASILLTLAVEEVLSDAEHMTQGELRAEVRRVDRLGPPRLPDSVCVHLAAGEGTRSCAECGADVPRHAPTVDDIPVLE